MKVLLIGGGYACCSVARMLMDMGNEVHIFEKSDSLGGMAKSFYIQGMTYEFGPHILANHNCGQEVIDFILKYIDVKGTSMETATFLQNQYLNYPPHISDVKRLKEKKQIEKELNNLNNLKADEKNFETYLISKVGKTLYELYFKSFSEKFWMVDPKILSADWAKLRHLGESLSEKRMFFNKTWCAYPINDFNELFDNISKGLDVHLKTSISKVDLDNTSITTTKGEIIMGDMIISSISLDKLFDNRYGKLAYRGYDIKPQIINKEYFHPQVPASKEHYSMVYYPEKNVPYTRITEYKSFNHKKKSESCKGRTIITTETPSKNAKFYPFMDEENELRFQKYLRLLSSKPNLVSLGRLGLYKYTTLDTTTQQIFRFIERFSTWQILSPEQRFQAYGHIRGDWSN